MEKLAAFHLLIFLLPVAVFITARGWIIAEMPNDFVSRWAPGLSLMLQYVKTVDENQIGCNHTGIQK